MLSNLLKLVLLNRVISMKLSVGRLIKGAILPGDSTVSFNTITLPSPGHGEVTIETKASTICGSDIRCIYREHLGKGAEGYQAGLICGHEASGVISEVGPGTKRLKVGDRVIVYHVSGCGVCYECRRGYMNCCTNDSQRKAYGWQRNGGMAPYMLAEEKDLILLPDKLSFLDGAQVACSFGTVYEGLEKISLGGNDAVLVTGLGPVGLAALQLSKAMGANMIIGIDTEPERLKLAMKLGLADHVLLSSESNVEEVRKLTGGHGCECTVDCSGNHIARRTCIKAARKWGRICFIGEGGQVSFDVSGDLIHDQKTIYGSWVTSLWKMEELVERIARWDIHPSDLVTHKFSLEEAPKAYSTMAEGKCGKVAVMFDS
eukprot:gene16014-21733_t